MTKTSSAILWVGLFLIAMIVWAHWSELRKLIFTPEKKTTTSGSGGSGGNTAGNWLNWIRSHIEHIWHLPGSPLPMP